jgi:hypothetical protein
MDRVLWQEHLQQTEGYVAQGQRHIARQLDIIVELEQHGRDTQSARDLLTLFESTQALHIAHRDRLRRELGEISPPGSDI